MIDLSLCYSSTIKPHAILILIEDREDHTAIKELVPPAIEDTDLLETLTDLSIIRDVILMRAVTEPDLKVSEDGIIRDSPGLEVLQPPLILTKNLVIERDHTIH